ncbi:MAG TPA: aquaporin [Candidatus Limnocylindrales bacterium]|nr:aquaporin [Candidatus Limnocylindrales bacterium]
MNVRALVAEAVGTFILLTFGFLGVATLSVIASASGGSSPVVALIVIPFSFGLGLMAAIAVGGHASGAHYNPAVTLAALFDGRVTWQNAIGYVVAQLVGGFAATLGILLTTTEVVVKNAVNAPGPTADSAFGTELHAFSTEAVLTAIFVCVILTVTKKQPDNAVLVIPFTLVAIHYAGMLISGASVNPVRSLAPAVVSGTYDSLWVYLTGPFVGSVLGWGIYKFLTPDDNEISVEIEEELEDDELEDELEDLLDADDDRE